MDATNIARVSFELIRQHDDRLIMAHEDSIAIIIRELDKQRACNSKLKVEITFLSTKFSELEETLNEILIQGGSMTFKSLNHLSDTEDVQRNESNVEDSLAQPLFAQEEKAIVNCDNFKSDVIGVQLTSVNNIDTSTQPPIYVQEANAEVNCYRSCEITNLTPASNTNRRDYCDVPFRIPLSVQPPIVIESSSTLNEVFPPSCNTTWQNLNENKSMSPCKEHDTITMRNELVSSNIESSSTDQQRKRIYDETETETELDIIQVESNNNNKKLFEVEEKKEIVMNNENNEIDDEIDEDFSFEQSILEDSYVPLQEHIRKKICLNNVDIELKKEYTNKRDSSIVLCGDDDDEIEVLSILSNVVRQEVVVKNEVKN